MPVQSETGKAEAPGRGEATQAEALDQILAAAGRPLTEDDMLSVPGEGPILPTNFLAEVAGTAAVAASGLAASDLWYRRSGRRQQVTVSRRRGAIAVSAFDFLRIDGGIPPTMWDPISGLWQGRDGRWIQFHCNFPHHRQGVLGVLGCSADRDAVAKAVARWDIPDLEDVLIDKGMCIAFVRHAHEWQGHPQCAAIAGLPLMEIERIGDSAPEPLPPAARPLSGIRVLDLTRHLAGPICGRTLAEHGADVMRVGAEHLPFIPTLVMDSGHGKINAYIDLRRPDGREQLRSLVRSADVFSQAYRPGSLDALGFGPEALAEARPGIVHVSISAFGHVGPWSGRRGFDSIIQSSSGIACENGDDRRPRHLPGNPLDYVAGYLGAFGAMVALTRRAAEGGSYRVRVSLAQTGRWVESLGRVQGQDARTRPPLSHADLGPLWQERETAFGRLGYVGPVAGLSDTPPYWDRPSMPLGTHPPRWPARN